MQAAGGARRSRCARHPVVGHRRADPRPRQDGPLPPDGAQRGRVRRPPHRRAEGGALAGAPLRVRRAARRRDGRGQLDVRALRRQGLPRRLLRQGDPGAGAHPRHLRHLRRPHAQRAQPVPQDALPAGDLRHPCKLQGDGLRPAPGRPLQVADARRGPARPPARRSLHRAPHRRRSGGHHRPRASAPRGGDRREGGARLERRRSSCSRRGTSTSSSPSSICRAATAPTASRSSPTCAASPGARRSPGWCTRAAPRTPMRSGPSSSACSTSPAKLSQESLLVAKVRALLDGRGGAALLARRHRQRSAR